MSKVYWVTAGSTLTINGSNFYGHIVMDAFSNLNLNCANMYGDTWYKGTVNLKSDATMNESCNIGSSPTAEWVMGK